MLTDVKEFFEEATSNEERAALAHYYAALASYRLASTQQKKGEMIKHLDYSIEHLEKAIEIDDQFTEGYALLGSALGWKSGLKPMQAMFLGPKATKMVATAKGMEPDNPRVLLVAAVSDYNTPKMFGGDQERAMEGFQQAIRVFEKEQVLDPMMPSWGHDETYAWIGQAYMAKGAEVQARAAFEKALEINPDYGWVKHVLLPKLDPGDSQ